MGTEPLVFVVALCASGLAAGLLGGLFGVGGGLIMTPVLFHLFGVMGVDDAVRAHAAIATSLTTILITSWRSLAAHGKAGAVDWALLKAWAPWLGLGAAAGAFLARAVGGEALLVVFGVVALGLAGQMAVGRDEWRLARAVPQGPAAWSLAGGIGGLSALMGIGGGAFGVTALTLCGRPIHQAVATASGFGAAIALPGALAYMIAGWGLPGLAPFSVGYVNLAGVAALGLFSGLAAPFGARLAHRLDRRLLRRLFALFLAATALNLLFEALS